MPAITTQTKSSKLWFRMVVPERLGAKIGKTEINFSLGTSDPAQAKPNHSKAQSEWRQRLIELDHELQSKQLSSAADVVEQALATLIRFRSCDSRRRTTEMECETLRSHLTGLGPNSAWQVPSADLQLADTGVAKPFLRTG